MSPTQDLRYALRLLARSRLSTTLAILSLALGIGATTAIFSVVYAVLIDPYPYTAANRIGGFRLLDSKGQEYHVSYTMAEYTEIRSASHTIESAILLDNNSVTLTDHDILEAVTQENFSPNAFEFFGVPPIFGRVFSTKDTGDESKVEDVAVLSYLFWQKHFLGRRDILGESIQLNNKFYTIIGVMPPRFTWQRADVYTPMAIRPASTERRILIFRAKAGIPKDQLNSEFQAFHQKFAKTAPNYIFPDSPFRSVFEPINENILGQFANTLLALLAAVGFLLMIACANVANLLLARASARRGEIAIRAALGAGGNRIVRQLLTESTLLSLAGGALGILFAYAGVKAVVALLPADSIPPEAVIAINIPVLCFAVAISVLTGIFFGMAPAFQLARQDQSAFLKDAGRGSDTASGTNRLRDILIVAEVALSLVLLTGAAFATSGLISLSHQKLGYDPKGILVTYVPSPAERHPQWSQRRTFFNDVADRLRQIPTVKSVVPTIIGALPVNGVDLKFNMAGLKEPVPVRINFVGESLLDVMRIPVLRGRFFNSAEVTRPSPVAVVSEDFVKTYFTHNEDPIGRLFSVNIPVSDLPAGFVQTPHPPASYEIVGVASSARNDGLSHDSVPAVYLPLNEVLSPGAWFAIRTTNPNPAAIHNDIRRAVSAVDPTQAVNSINNLDYFFGREFAYPRFATFLFGIFGAIGLALATIGIFGVVSYSVSRRTREFGIRMALGATPANILRLVLSATGRILLIGLVLGTIISIIAARTLGGKLQGIDDASNPTALILVVALLATAALMACLLPARTATQIHPVEALRHE
jgi:predicted permease